MANGDARDHKIHELRAHFDDLILFMQERERELEDEIRELRGSLAEARRVADAVMDKSAATVAAEARYIMETAAPMIVETRTVESVEGGGGDDRLVKIPSTGVPLEDIERQAIIEALKMCFWVQKSAAELLSVSPRALNYKIKMLGIEFPPQLKQPQPPSVPPEGKMYFRTCNKCQNVFSAPTRNIVECPACKEIRLAARGKALVELSSARSSEDRTHDSGS